MRRPMTRAEAQAFRARWQLVNDAEREELRATPMAVKARQLGTLMGWAGQLGWTESRAAEEQVIRERWQRLRKAYGV